MRTFAMLYGGSNYTAPDTADEYPNLAAVVDEYRRRQSGYSGGVRFPCWGDGVADYSDDGRGRVALVWWLPNDAPAEEIETVGEGYPDKVLSLGPRGGFRWGGA